jgi:hypothetical protein
MGLSKIARGVVGLGLLNNESRSSLRTHRFWLAPSGRLVLRTNFPPLTIIRVLRPDVEIAFHDNVKFPGHPVQPCRYNRLMVSDHSCSTGGIVAVTVTSPSTAMTPGGRKIDARWTARPILRTCKFQVKTRRLPPWSRENSPRPSPPSHPIMTTPLPSSPRCIQSSGIPERVQV